MGDGGGLDFQAGIFQLQKIMAEARRRAKRAASSCRQLSPLRAGKLQKPISKESKGSTKRKMGGAGWWRAALRLLRWESRDRREDNNSADNTNAEEKEEKSKPMAAPAVAPGTLYFVSAELYSIGRSRPRKRRAGWLRADQRVMGEGMGMMMLKKRTPYMSLVSDQDSAEDVDDERSRIVALVSRPPPPPPIYWVT